MKEVIIKGVGAYAPSNIITNDHLSKLVDTNDEWIFSRTGIRERRISTGEDTSDIAVKAALDAMDHGNVLPEDIDLIIVATVTPDMFTPSVACLVQKEINAVNAVAFDINAACSGFMYAVDIATAMMRTLNYSTALVIGAETLSKSLNWEDRGTCVLFGDGGGAAILSTSTEKGVINSYSKAEGDKGDCLTMGALSVKNPYVETVEEKFQKIEMDGRAVFKFATRVIPESINKVLEGTGYKIDDIKYIVPHQANVRIIDFSSRKLGVDKEKFYVNLDRYGNTSSASIPIALNELVKGNKLQKGDKIILVGFGAGLTYGAILIEWN